MGRRHFKPEQIIHMLREAEIKLAGGKRIGEVCRELGISEQSYYRWRKEYGGMQVSQAKKLKDLERENAQLKKLVADQALDKSILEEALKGNY
jgi:putative transposase